MGRSMAETQNYDVDHPAEMDYREHEKTYELFLLVVRWGIVSVVAILAGMAVGLLAGGGAIGGFVTFLIILGIGYTLR